MSRQAIAAALALGDLATGVRLVAFSLASFADRENRARPGTPAAAERAGLKRSWFLEARDTLVRRVSASPKLAQALKQQLVAIEAIRRLDTPAPTELRERIQCAADEARVAAHSTSPTAR